MKNTASPKSEISSHSYSAFDPQNKSQKDRRPNSSNTSKTMNSNRSSLSRTDEINIRTWNLSEKNMREYDRNFNGQRARSPNFKLNLLGSMAVSSLKENTQDPRFEKHKVLRTRDFQSNINNLPNPKNIPTKEATEVEFLTSPKQRTVLSTLTNDTFYFKASDSVFKKKNSTVQKEDINNFISYNRGVKQFELPNRKRNQEREVFLFHSPRNF